MIDLTIQQALEKLQKKDVSSVELTRAYLERIRKIDPKINAFVTVTEKEALKAAKEADLKRAAGSDLPLLGIPFSMKDVYSTKGIKTTAGSKVLGNYIPPYNATVYQKLIDAGAVLLGKTNCDAWGHGASTENSDFGVTKNPWNEEYVAGGSSGGSAAAVASDMAVFEIGEDTGGSIRMPSSFCSVVGLKTTYGRVSRYGAIAYASSLDTMGPVTKNVEDAAFILKIIAGKDEKDATSSNITVPDYSKILTKSIKGIRIGYPSEFFEENISSEVKQILQKAVKKFESLGAKIINISLPSVKYGISTYYIIAPSETSSNLAKYDGIRYGNDRSFFGDEAKRRIMIGTYALSSGYYDAYYKKAMQLRTLIRSDFEKAFDNCDVIFSPVSPIPPFRIGEKADHPLEMYLVDFYAVPMSLAGIPSLALPAGFSKSGLPIGMQLAGPQFSEEKLLNVGYQYEQQTDWHKMKPNL